ncbi:MAG: hypothetical protein WCD70_07210 [Alphaproteobacteria bacterium]
MISNNWEKKNLIFPVSRRQYIGIVKRFKKAAEVACGTDTQVFIYLTSYATGYVKTVDNPRAIDAKMWKKSTNITAFIYPRDRSFAAETYMVLRKKIEPRTVLFRAEYKDDSHSSKTIKHAKMRSAVRGRRIGKYPINFSGEPR